MSGGLWCPDQVQARVTNRNDSNLWHTYLSCLNLKMEGRGFDCEVRQPHSLKGMAKSKSIKGQYMQVEVWISVITSTQPIMLPT